MRPESSNESRPPEYLARRRQTKLRRQRLAVGAGLVVVLVLVIVLAVTSSRGETSATATSTTAKAGATSTSAAVATTASAPVTYEATLAGSSEVPSVKTSAQGLLRLTVAGDQVDYSLTVTKLSSPSIARLHQGKQGATGPTIATLFGGSKNGTFTGTLAEGTLSAADLTGPLAGKTIADLVQLIEGGSIYLNVGSAKHPGGELRGQVK